MKKILSVILAGTLALSLTACGGGEKGESGKAFDPEADSQTLLDSGAFSGEPEEVDQATACALYGIDEATVESCKVYVGNVGVSLEELAVFTLSDEDAAETALTCLEYRVEDQKEAAAGYAGFLQEELDKLDGAVVRRRDNSVLLVIAADYAPVETFLGED